jgi:hypothetical protein
MQRWGNPPTWGDARRIIFKPEDYAGATADMGDALCPDGEQELPGLQDQVHGGPDAAATTSIASGLQDGLSSA